LFVVVGEMPHIEALWFPLFVALQVVFTTGVVLLLSSVIVFLRDLRHALPLILQLGLFATPVVWNLRSIQGDSRVVYAFFNPLGTVIDGLRTTALLGEGPDWQLVGVSTTSSLLLLACGYWVFKRLEPGIADVA